MGREQIKGKETVSATIELTKPNHKKAMIAKAEIGGSHIQDGVNHLLNKIK